MLLAAFIFAACVATVAVWICVRLMKQNMMLEDQREDLVDKIESSLDLLDECYSRLSHASELPVLSDDPIIQGVVSDIKLAKNAVLVVASRIVVYGEEENQQ